MLKSTRSLVVSLGVAGALALALPAMAVAGSVTSSFNVTADVVGACTIDNTVNDLDFGDYNPLEAVATSGATGNGVGKTTIDVKCSNGTDYVVALDYGSNGGSATDRFMLITGGGSDTLAYNLYTDTNFTNVWENSSTCDTPGASSQSCTYGSGDGLNDDSIAVYGQIDASTSPAPPVGSYQDTVQVTVTF